MAKGMTLKRPSRPGALISLVPMIDVMMILLVFFMVTSTYLNLDMIPAVHQADDAPAAATPSQGPGETVMIRLGSDGIPAIAGRSFDAAALMDFLGAKAAEDPTMQVLVLPSGAATTQSLITVMDSATRAGVLRLRVIRLEARP